MAAAPEIPTPNSEAAEQAALSNLLLFYRWFASVAASFTYDKQARSQAYPGMKGCPTAKCWATVTLCGQCMTDDVPGNLFFGFAAAAAGVSDGLRNFAAHLKEATDGDPEGPADEDVDVFPFGKELFEKGSTDICSVVSRLAKHTTRGDCSPCNQVGEFPNKEPFRDIGYPNY
jgi:hypothetical protein